ncbi:MAG: hypothetical protein HOI53_04595 [Francisellaceae bacterium]|nr:hypothetical protein [Francisellaceae bacterium]
MKPLIRSVYRRYILHYGCNKWPEHEEEKQCLDLIRAYFSAVRYQKSITAFYTEDFKQPATELFDSIRGSVIIHDQALFKFLDGKEILIEEKRKGSVPKGVVVAALQDFLESEREESDSLMKAVLRHVNILQKETDDLYRFCFALATDIVERNSASGDEPGVKGKSKAKKATTFFNKMKGDAHQVYNLAKMIYIKFTQKLVREATAKAQKGAEDARGENSGLETERSDFSQLKDIIKEEYGGKLSYYYKSEIVNEHNESVGEKLHKFYSKNYGLVEWFNGYTIKGLKIDMDKVSLNTKQDFVESVANACVMPVAEGYNSIIEEMISGAKFHNRPEPDEVKSPSPGVL